MAEKVKFQYEEPKDGQLTLGFVLHIVRLKQVKELLPDAEVIGYVVERGER